VSAGKDQFSAAGTLGVDVSHDGFRLRLIIYVGQILVAGFAEAEIAEVVVVDAVVADAGADTAHIADIVDNACPLKSKLMANRTPLLRAWRHTAAYTVVLLADAAHGTAQSLLTALDTQGFGHLFITPHEEL
jgi:hypothetical protein